MASYEQMLAGITGLSGEARRQAIAKWRAGEFEALTGEGIQEREQRQQLPEMKKDIEALQWEGLLPPGTEQVVEEKITGQPTFEPEPAQASFGGEPTGGAEFPERLFTTAPQTGLPPPPGGIGAGMPGLGGITGALEAREAARPGMLEELQAPYEQRREAIGERREVSEAQAEAEAQQREFNRLTWETEVAAQREREGQRQQYINAEIGKLRDEMDVIKTSGVDPMNWYKHPDGSNNYGKSIAAAIAVTMGFFGKRRGGQNEALNIINRAIDRDIDAQKANLASRRAGVGMQMNLLGRMQNQFASERQQDAATRLVMTETAKMKLEEAASVWKGPLQRAAYDDVIAQLDQQQAQEKVKFQEASLDQAIGKEAELYKARAGRAGAIAKQRAAMAKAGPPAMPPGMEVLDPTRAMPTKKDFERAKGMVGAQRNVERMINDLLAWREQHGYEPLTGPALATANTMLGRLKSAMRKVDESGARLEEAEVEMMGLNFEMGDLGMIKERLTAVRDSVTNKVIDALHPMNIRLSGAPTGGARRRQ
jgi:hypothetical protein